MAKEKIDEKAIFNVARQISSPEARREYLGQACGADNELLARLETLLFAYAEQSSFLEKPLEHGLSPTIDQPLVEKAGTVIGPYKLLQQIGEGGMGVVYMAEQAIPIARMVALKIIKPGMDTGQVVARFEAERQALAMMDHPNIAKVLDAGTTESQRPYFVMELVKGVPITNYCDDHHLTPKERLELFIQVLHAVQHAHQKGIIHRDIKPSNVLVAEYDQQAVPKVIDFGVAKATSQKLTDKTMFTQFGQLVGTLEYMSPEQAKLNQMDIDTRCDIYSLGVLLYELLTGDTPFDRQRLRSAAFEEMMRIIREEEPPVPSTRLNTSGMLASVSANRSTEPRRLSNFMRGELDWIVMRAMEKERSRRYETPNAFADDIQRFLNQEAVVARPVSTAYRMKKFAQRNWGTVIAGSIIAATLLLGFGTSTWFAIRESLAAAEADKQRILALAAKTDADSQRDVAQRAASDEARQRETAQRLAVEASAARETLRETLYVAEMNLVQAAVEDKHYMRASQLLEQQHPTNGQSDLRGFEWHYWHRQLHYRQLRSIGVSKLSGLGTLNASTNTLRIFSQDAKRLAAILVPGEGSTPRALVGVFDSLTGRELFAPFDPFPEQKHIQLRNLSLALSDDGTRMAVRNTAVSEESGARTTHITIHDSISGKEIRRFEQHPGPAGEFFLSADGSRLAVRYLQLDSIDRSRQTLPSGQAGIQVWNTSTGELVQTLPSIPASIQSSKIVWDPAGARLLRSSVSNNSDDGPSRLKQRFVLVDVMTGKDLWEREFSDIAYHLTPWSWSPDGKLIAVAEHEPPAKPKVQLWDGNTGATVAVLDRDAPAKISSGTLAFSPDGLHLAMPSSKNEIYVWQLPQLDAADLDQPLRIEKPDLVLPTAKEIVALSFGADSRELTGVDSGNSITTWNVTRDESIDMGPDQAQGLLYAAFSPDASKFAFFAGSFGRPDNSYVLWDLERNSEILRLASPQAHRPDFTPDGRRVAFVRATINDSGPILIHDTQTGAMLVEIPVEWIDASIPALIIDLTIRPDGNHFAAILRNKKSPETKSRLNVWEIATGQLVFSVVIDSEQPAGVSYSRDGASLIVGTTRPSEVVYYDAATGVRQQSVSLPPSSNPLFVDTPHQVIGASHGSDFILSDVTTGHELLRLSGYDRVRPNSYAISPDGSRLALGSSSLSGDGEITLWSMKTGRQLLSFHEDRPVDAMAFSPNGNRLLATSSTFLVRSAASPSKPIQVFDATPLVKKQ